MGPKILQIDHSAHAFVLMLVSWASVMLTLQPLSYNFGLSLDFQYIDFRLFRI